MAEGYEPCPSNIADVRIERKYFEIPANTDRLSVSAWAVSGYTFAGWIGGASSGWVGLVYPENNIVSQTNFWAEGGAVPQSRGIFAIALYKKIAS